MTAEEVAAWLVGVAPRWLGTGDDPYDVLLAMRAAEPKLVPTYLGALALRGAELSAAGRAEVAAAAARRDMYVALAARLVARHPELRLVKGPAVVACYPAPLVRYLGDLDVVVADERAVWALAGELAEEGWRRHRLAVSNRAGRRDLLLTLMRPAAADEPYHAVQIGTAELPGGRRGLPAVPMLPSSASEGARALVGVVAERAERPYGLRDVLDARLVLAALPPADLTDVRRMLADAGLARPARELRRLLTDPAPAPGGVVGRGARWGARLRAQVPARRAARGRRFTR